MNEHPIHLTHLSFGPETEELVLGVLRSGQLAQGPMVERFEALCTQMTGATHAVAVGNGTLALEAALEVLGIGPGDEVVTTPLTFAATLNAVLQRGASVRFADIAPDFTVDPAAVDAVVGPATAALLPVHLYGLPADLVTLSALAERKALALVEDAAQAHGARCGSGFAGGFGLGCFSFYATKNVTTGEGGVVTTSDAHLARRLRLLRNQGMVERYQYEMVGRNLRMTDLQAAVGIPQLEHLAEILDGRRANAAALSALLAEAAPDVELPVVPAGRESAWHQYTVLLPPGRDRAAVAGAMAGRGVSTGVYYPRLVWDYEPYRDHPAVHRGDTPRAADAAARCLSLPIHQHLREADLERVATALAAAVRSEA